MSIPIATRCVYSWRDSAVHPAGCEQPTDIGRRDETGRLAGGATTGATDWIGSIQCTLLGNDNQTLADQLGYRIGGTLGKRVDNGPL
jgi:hypothetical protein